MTEPWAYFEECRPNKNNKMSSMGSEADRLMLQELKSELVFQVIEHIFPLRHDLCE